MTVEVFGNGFWLSKRGRVSVHAGRGNGAQSIQFSCQRRGDSEKRKQNVIYERLDDKGSD